MIGPKTEKVWSAEVDLQALRKEQELLPPPVDITRQISDAMEARASALAGGR